MPRRLSSAEFFERLRVLHTIEERRAFERELGTEQAAILAADSSGFTRTTQRHGIVHFLGVMALAYAELVPIIEHAGGTVLSENADNILAIFDDARRAGAAALAMHEAMARRYASVAEIERFSVCLGIDQGPVLRLSDNAYGDHVKGRSRSARSSRGEARRSRRKRSCRRSTERRRTSERRASATKT